MNVEQIYDFKWLLGILFVGPFAWMYARMRKMETDIDKLRDNSATKQEMQEAFNGVKEDTAYLRNKLDKVMEHLLKEG